MKFVGALVMVFVQLEVRQALVPAPRIVACDLRPLVVVTRLAAHVNHAVDAGASAEHLATGVTQAAPIQAFGGFRLVQPVGARVADAVEVAHGNVDPVVIVFFACFD